MGILRRTSLLALLALGAVAPAAGAADWRDGGLITDPDLQAQPLSAVVGGSGDAAFAWSGYVQRGSQPLVRSRPRENALDSPALLSTDSESVRAFGNAGDDLLLISTTPLATPTRVLARSGTVREAQSPPETLFAAGENEFVCGSTAALAPSGRAIVLYGVAPGDGMSPSQPDFDRCSLRMRVRASRGADFGPEIALSGPTGSTAFQVAFDQGGRAIVAWSEPPAGSPFATTIRAVRVDPETGPSAQQAIAVPGELPASPPPPQLRVGRNGRALLAFASIRSNGGRLHVAAASGDTSSGFDTAQVLSGPAVLSASYGSDLDSAVGDDGTAAVVWRAGSLGAAKVQGSVAGPSEPVTDAGTRTLSRAQARGPRVAVGAGRANIAWFRLVSGVGRSVEARTGRPGSPYTRVTRLSEGTVSAGPPEVDTSSRGEAWFTWGERPIGSGALAFTVLRARKLTVASGAYSRGLDVLRARSGEQLFNYDIVRSSAGAMLAVVERQRPASRPADARGFWQLRTYGE